MKKLFNGLLGKNEVAEKENQEQCSKIVANNEGTTQTAANMDNLIKMKEAMALIKASAPTVRKYARMGYYSEYRFGEKLVFYDKQEMLNFIMGSKHAK